MLGTGLGHYIPLVAYLGFWVMCFVSLGGRPLLGLYYMMPFLPYRTMRDHFLDYPLGSNMLTFLVIAVIVGALFQGKRLPKSKLYVMWLVFGIYLYLSMWIGTALGNAPAPLWLSDLNFVTWKDYMLIPLVFVAAGLVIEDRKAIRKVVLITAICLLFIDRSCILESMSRTWATFDENKRGMAAHWLMARTKQGHSWPSLPCSSGGSRSSSSRRKFKLFSYGLVAVTVFAIMYTFSRGAYLAIVVCVIVLGAIEGSKASSGLRGSSC